MLATNTLNISGWHATDQSAGKDHHFIILYMMPLRTGELGRYEVNSRNSVMMLPGLHNVYNAGKSGFNLQVNISPALIGDNIQVISRYSNAANGEEQLC